MAIRSGEHVYDEKGNAYRVTGRNSAKKVGDSSGAIYDKDSVTAWADSSSSSKKEANVAGQEVEPQAVGQTVTLQEFVGVNLQNTARNYENGRVTITDRYTGQLIGVYDEAGVYEEDGHLYTDPTKEIALQKGMIYHTVNNGSEYHKIEDVTEEFGPDETGQIVKKISMDVSTSNSKKALEQPKISEKTINNLVKKLQNGDLTPKKDTNVVDEKYTNVQQHMDTMTQAPKIDLKLYGLDENNYIVSKPTVVKTIDRAGDLEDFLGVTEEKKKQNDYLIKKEKDFENSDLKGVLEFQNDFYGVTKDNLKFMGNRASGITAGVLEGAVVGPVSLISGAGYAIGTAAATKSLDPLVYETGAILEGVGEIALTPIKPRFGETITDRDIGNFLSFGVPFAAAKVGKLKLARGKVAVESTKGAPLIEFSSKNGKVGVKTKSQSILVENAKEGVLVETSKSTTKKGVTTEINEKSIIDIGPDISIDFAKKEVKVDTSKKGVSKKTLEKEIIQKSGSEIRVTKARQGGITHNRVKKTGTIQIVEEYSMNIEKGTKYQASGKMKKVDGSLDIIEKDFQSNRLVDFETARKGDVKPTKNIEKIEISNEFRNNMGKQEAGSSPEGGFIVQDILYEKRGATATSPYVESGRNIIQVLNEGFIKEVSNVKIAKKSSDFEVMLISDDVSNVKTANMFLSDGPGALPYPIIEIGKKGPNGKVAPPKTSFKKTFSDESVSKGPKIVEIIDTGKAKSGGTARVKPKTKNVQNNVKIIEEIKIKPTNIEKINKGAPIIAPTAGIFGGFGKPLKNNNNSKDKNPIINFEGNNEKEKNKNKYIITPFLKTNTKTGTSTKVNLKTNTKTGTSTKVKLREDTPQITDTIITDIEYIPTPELTDPTPKDLFEEFVPPIITSKKSNSQNTKHSKKKVSKSAKKWKFGLVDWF